MALEVYTNGDFDMIVGAYNGLAMLYDDAGGMYYAAGIVSILALLGWALFKVYDPRASSPTHQFFIGWLVFLTLAGPQSKTSVEITSNRTGQTQTIDNVPFIVAFGGSLSSSLLTTVTEKLKTAFSVVYPIGTPYEVIGNLEPLQAIVKLNEMDYLTTGLCTFQNTQLCQNVISYYTYCVQRDQVTGGSKQETAKGNILNASPVDLMDTLKITYSGWSAPYLTTGASVPANYSCPVVYNKIKSLMNTSAFEDLMAKEMEAKGIRTEGANQAAAMLTGAAVDGYEVAKSRFISQLIARANQNSGVLTGGDVLVAQTEFQAKEQMQAKSAGSAQLFNDMAPVLITAIEFFTLFIAPVTVSLLVVGRYGVTAVTNYLLLMVMTNLWPLCMVGIESFIQFALMSAADGSFDGTSLSINGIGGLIDRVKTYLAVGSVLMASIPTLSMYILSRNVGSMASLAGSIANSPPVNAHYVAPNLSTAPDAGVSRAGKDVAYSDDMSKSGSVSGRQGIGTTISHSATVSGTAQHTLANIQAKQHQIASQMAESILEANGVNSSGGDGGNSSFGHTGAAGKGRQYMNNEVKQLMETQGLSEKEALTQVLSDRMDKEFSVNGGLSFGSITKGLLPFGMGFTGSNTNSTAVSNTSGVDASMTTLEGKGATLGDTTTTSGNKTTNASDSQSLSYNNVGSKSDQAQKLQAYMKQYAALSSESESVSNVLQSSQQVQNQSTSNTLDVASRYGRHKQEDFVNALSPEIKEKLQSIGAVDSTGAFSGKYSEMWQQNRQLNENYAGMNNVQKDNLATVDTLRTLADDTASKGGAENYSTAAGIYNTLNNGSPDGKLEGAHDRTLMLIANDYQTMSGTTGKEALQQQVENANMKPNIGTEVDSNIDQQQANVQGGIQRVTSKAEKLLHKGQTAINESQVDDTYQQGVTGAKNDHLVAKGTQDGVKIFRNDAVDNVMPSNSPRRTKDVVYQDAADRREKQEAQIHSGDAKAKGNPDPEKQRHVDAGANLSPASVEKLRTHADGVYQKQHTEAQSQTVPVHSSSGKLYIPQKDSNSPDDVKATSNTQPIFGMFSPQPLSGPRSDSGK